MGPPHPAVYRYFASTAYDAQRHAALMLGGFSQYPAEYSWWPIDYGDLWRVELDGSQTWSAILPDSVAPSFAGQSMIIDTHDDRIVTFAGVDRGTATPGGLSQLPLSGVGGWTSLQADGTPPMNRDLHTAIYDPVRSRMVIFGGRGYPSLFGDTWMLSLGAPRRWERMDSVTAGPPPRFGHSAIYDPIGDRMIIFGGTIGGACYGDLWQLSLGGIAPAWSPLPAGSGPAPRAFAAMIYDSRRQRIILLGGRGEDGTPLNDMWILPLADGAVWSLADSSAFPPGPRWGAASFYDPDHDAVVLAFGVSDPCAFAGGYEDGWVLPSTDPTPEQVPTSVGSANPWDVRLNWSRLPVDGFTGTVERRTTVTVWNELGRVVPDASGRVAFVDRTAEPGTRYDYRLRWSAGRIAGTSVEQWVSVAELRLALACANPNPSSDGVTIFFSLPNLDPAEVGLFDLAGRRRASFEVGQMGPGDHTLRLAAAGALSPGVYLVRIRHGSESRVVRISVLH
jgi:hypothetical protein